MQCTDCQHELLSSFKYCPGCGTKLQKSLNSNTTKIPERFVTVIAEYESLTNTKLSESQKLRFIEYPPVGQLSVNAAARRIAAAKKILKPNGDGTFKLDVLEWANSMYQFKDPQANPELRVWMTSGGDRYHRNRECKALAAGQSFAIWKGKEIYKPQFITLKEAAWVFGKIPCEVCKPQPWK